MAYSPNHPGILGAALQNDVMNHSPTLTIPLPPPPIQRLLAIACENAPKEVNALVVYGSANIPIRIPVFDFQVQLLSLAQAMLSSLLGMPASGSGTNWSAAEMLTPKEVSFLTPCQLAEVYSVLHTPGNKLGQRTQEKKLWLITFGQATSWIRSCKGAADEVRLWSKLMAYRAEQERRKGERKDRDKNQEDIT